MTSKIKRPRKNPIGYSVIMYTKTGGAVSWWNSSLEDALREVSDWKGSQHEAILLVKIPYSQRMRRHVVQRAKNLKDSGIYSQ